MRYMLERINESVSVVTVYNAKTKKVYPVSLGWKGRTYRITDIGLYHNYKEGACLFHIFSVTDGKLFFRLSLNTENLHWRLEEVSDGMAN